MLKLEEEKLVENFNNNNSNFKLFRKDNVLYLQSILHKDWLPFFIDFSSNEIIRRKNQMNYSQEIAKAVGVKKDFKPKILDTTAGQGRDSFLLASLGCEMIMLERNSVIFLLLNNAIENAKNNVELIDSINRMTLLNQDSIEFLKNNKEYFDVIYIDPMFPKSHKSRLVKKDMQLFREIVGDDLDSVELLRLSMQQNVKRIVVKRMLNSPFINNLKPNFQIKGKTTRFDVYT